MSPVETTGLFGVAGKKLNVGICWKYGEQFERKEKKAQKVHGQKVRENCGTQIRIRGKPP